jgi:glycosyltransferase involved in cell wall biosynthesis/SAM-dependent methyltransferase
MMRVAFLSPLPPARSGIADYSAALLEALAPLTELSVFSAGATIPADRFDIALYQIGNNGHHAFVYEEALRRPGVVALHEHNLHHLVADLTIKRGDWDAYVEECAYNGGPEARAMAERVRSLQTGPDYDGLKMTRRLLETARGVVVHSRFMEEEVRAAGFTGPLAVIPHGAWIAQGDRNGFRRKLGLDELTPLAGIFGFLKPYKRIPESLRAFRRLTRLVPEAKMILVGEPHPDLPLQPMIDSMGLSANVRVLDFTPEPEFVGYLAACDFVLNLRYPTVGESSGTLLRAMGLGKAALVSEVGSFRELPDDVCAKVPAGPAEEETIFEYLNLFTSRPEVAREVGARARDYVARECAWPSVARRYAEFLEGVLQCGASPGRPSVRKELRLDEEGMPGGPLPTVSAPIPYLRTWATSDEALRYIETHQSRLAKTLEMIPPGDASERILEMGAYLQITPALRSRLGYGEVRGCYFGTPGRTDHRAETSTEGEAFACDIDHFDAEKDAFPYPDGHFSTVLCCELIEHLFADPMHLMVEANRILKPGGHLLITTPNIASLRAVDAVLQGYHPGFYPAYLRPAAPDAETAARHNREYTPREIRMLLENSGFEVVRLETGEFRDAPHPEYGWVGHLLERYRLETNLRGDGIFALGRKTGPVRQRYPEWLYA